MFKVSCNDDIEWYKSLKETRALVEMTLYGQMDNIRRCGYYIVGGRSNVAMDTIHDVIELVLTPQEEIMLLKTIYTLNELRDLESKIVLITGTRAENRAAVDHFLNVSSLRGLLVCLFNISLLVHFVPAHTSDSSQCV